MQVRLITAALALPESQPDRAGYLDELAYAYEKLGRFEEAIDAMRQAVAAGWEGELDDHPSAQALIADLLLRAGRDQEADEAWAQAEREDPRNPWVHSAASDAYTRVGLYRKALPWQTKGLELALAAGEDEGELAWYLTGERGETMDVLGLAPDELQLRAEELIERQEQQDREVRARVPAQLEPATRRSRRSRRTSALRGSRPTSTRGRYRHGRASPRTTSTVPTPRTAHDSSYCCATSQPKASNASRSRRSRSTTTSPGAAEHDRDPEESDTRASYATSSSTTTSPNHGLRNETSPAGAAANASTRSAASARTDS